MAEPKVRFKRDDGSSYPAWTMQTVGEMTVELTDYKPLGCGLPLLTSSRTGLMFQDEYRSKSSTENDNTLFSVVPRGAVTYRHMSDDNIFHFNINELVDEGLVSKEYPVFNTVNGNDVRLLVEYLNSSKAFLEFCKAQKKGGTRTRLYFKVLKGFGMMFPQPEEQQKIADFLSSVDEVITSSEQEVANLETQKKAVMKKIFSQEVRFKRADGSDFPEWEEVKVLDMLVQPITDGPHETPELVEDGVPFVSVEAIENGRVNLNKRRGNITKEYDDLCAKKYKPQLYDVYMVKSGATTGKMGIVTIEDDFNIWSPLAAMRTASKTEAFFLFFMLQSDLLQKQVWTKLSLGNQPNLGMRALEEFDAVRPCLEEQRLIADFLSDFDEAIAAAKKELELWKELKKGLLQQMFV